MPDDTKIFDVSKPGRTTPAPTSRPIIMGQSPVGSDPMVKDETLHADEATTSAGTPIHVAMADEEPVNVMATPTHPDIPSLDSELIMPENPEQNARQQEPPESFHPPTGSTIPPHELEQQEPEQSPGSTGAGNFTPLSSLIPTDNSKEDTGEYGSHHIDNLPQDHDGDPGWREAPPLPISPGAGPKRRWPKIFGWLFLLVVLVLIAGYLAVDAGLVKSDVKLPFHIFNKQKTSSAATTSTAPTVKNTKPVSQAPVQSAVPDGFTSYKVTDTNVSFAYPTAWGTPAVTKDPGFSKRGGTNKTDGTHAYLVDFAANKDVQLALTSSAYLPAARGTMYYDFLAWCIGTNDKKFYKQSLHFTTADKVDTPSTVTCDQGPLTDAAKLDDSTIVQLKTKDASGAILGDLYTNNLTSNTDLPVLRVKDVAMKNGDDIKKLLATIKTQSTSSGTSSTTP